MNAELKNRILAEYRNRKIRGSMLLWGPVASRFALARHHRLLCSKLQAIATGKSLKPNLMILLPPGSAKSTYGSVAFPTWFLANRERVSILACSHSAELANHFGRRCRDTVEEHKILLGYELAKDSRAMDQWRTDKDCAYRGVGVGAGIAGFRADLGLIDDPIGKKEDADSKLIRDKMWDWYDYEFKTRLKPGAPTVLIMTPWHEDDLHGRILAREPDQWEVIRVPLLAEENDPLGRPEGESLWPEYFTPEHITKAKSNDAFTALYQCRPSPEEGDFFRWDWMEPALYHSSEQIPKAIRNYCSSDHALTTKEENDRHCLIPFGVDEHDDIWIYPDVWWKRADTLELVEAMLDMVARRQPVEWFAEEEHIFKAIGPFLNKRQQERKIYATFTGIISNRDLQQRAASIRGRMKMCKVHLPAFASWFHDAKHELLSFPVGTHDDFVAALAKVGQGLDKMTRAFVATPDPVEAINAEWKPTMGWLKRNDKNKKTGALYGGR